MRPGRTSAPDREDAPAREGTAAIAPSVHDMIVACQSRDRRPYQELRSDFVDEYGKIRTSTSPSIPPAACTWWTALGFLAGFSERWAQDTIVNSAPTFGSGKSRKTEPAEAPSAETGTPSAPPR